MTEKQTKILKYSGMGAILLGSGACYFAGMSESTVTGIVGGVFVFVALVMTAIKS